MIGAVLRSSFCDISDSARYELSPQLTYVRCFLQVFMKFAIMVVSFKAYGMLDHYKDILLKCGCLNVLAKHILPLPEKADETDETDEEEDEEGGRKTTRRRKLKRKRIRRREKWLSKSRKVTKKLLKLLRASRGFRGLRQIRIPSSGS